MSAERSHHYHTILRSEIAEWPFDYFRLPWMCSKLHVNTTGWYFRIFESIFCGDIHDVDGRLYREEKLPPDELMLVHSSVLQQAFNEEDIEDIEYSPFFLVPCDLLPNILNEGVEWWDFNKATGHWDIYGMCTLSNPYCFHDQNFLRPLLRLCKLDAEYSEQLDRLVDVHCYLPPPTPATPTDLTTSSSSSESSASSSSTSSSESNRASLNLHPSFPLSSPWKPPPSLPPFTCLTDTWLNDLETSDPAFYGTRFSGIDFNLCFAGTEGDIFRNFLRFGKHYPWTQAEQDIRDKQSAFLATRTDRGYYGGLPEDRRDFAPILAFDSRIRYFGDMGDFVPLCTIARNLFRIIKPPNICFCYQREVACPIRFKLPKNAANYTHIIYFILGAFVVIYNAQNLDSLILKIYKSDEEDSAPSSSSQSYYSSSSSSSSAPSLPQSAPSSSPFAVVFSTNAIITYDVSSCSRHKLSREVRFVVRGYAAKVQVSMFPLSLHIAVLIRCVSIRCLALSYSTYQNP